MRSVVFGEKFTFWISSDRLAGLDDADTFRNLHHFAFWFGHFKKSAERRAEGTIRD
jgi:hypothetical protein